MKMLALVTFLLMSLSSFASNVIITPYAPADCRIKNYESVNWIYLVEKSYEDENTAVFTFNTKFGSCKDQQIETKEITLHKTIVTLFQTNLNIPFSKSPVAINIEHFGSKNEARVVLTFNKERLFKKYSSRKFILDFYPFPEKFSWYLQIKKDSNNNAVLSFTK